MPCIWEKSEHALGQVPLVSNSGERVYTILQTVPVEQTPQDKDKGP